MLFDNPKGYHALLYMGEHCDTSRRSMCGSISLKGRGLWRCCMKSETITRKELIAHCLTFADTWEDYPFGEDWAVMRHQANRKSFAMIYERFSKLCVNLKCEPMRADFLRGAFESVTPAYHMNKEHWNTVTLGGDVLEDELFEMIRHSHEITGSKRSKRG